MAALENSALTVYIHTFASALCDAIRDMTGQEYQFGTDNAPNISPTSFEGVTIFSQFSGITHGHYVITFPESTIVSFVKSIAPSITAPDEIFSFGSELFKEILNIAVGKAIQDLGREIGMLTFVPATIGHGKVIFPPYMSAKVDLKGDKGGISVVFLLNLAPLRIALKLEETKRSLDERTYQARTDALTGLYNRAYLESFLPEIMDDAQKNGKLLSLVIIDVDYFKSFNDTFGHAFGDLVLQTIAGSIRKVARKDDHAFRFGGDEFIVVLPESNTQGAEAYAERLQKSLAKQKLEAPVLNASKSISPTLSMGIAEFSKEDADFGALLSRADHALYQAKNQGRNRIITDGVNQ
jgi:diguanylate cyclase (GGDEF)-like protein